jgi:hypothetical protein
MADNHQPGLKAWSGQVQSVVNEVAGFRSTWFSLANSNSTLINHSIYVILLLLIPRLSLAGYMLSEVIKGSEFKSQ